MWLDLLKSVAYGVLEGVTEWLPISSTGHLILLGRVLSLPLSAAAQELFEVVIQLCAILAVLVLFWRKLIPFGGQNRAEQPRQVLSLWGKVLLATLPSAVLGLLLDDLITRHLFRPLVVAGALILYGVLFCVLEKWKRDAPMASLAVETATDIPARTAFFVGCFQVLALVPGTSRSGATILGGVLMGLSRPAAAEFSFLLGLPTMLGAGLLKGVKLWASGVSLTGSELALILSGCLVAFLTSLAVIRFLMEFVRRHSFAGFGVYRILLGGAVIAASLI